MCGIIGYTGAQPALSRVIDGLRRLEYRGYDSAGVALATSPGIPLIVEKRAGKLSNLESVLTSDIPAGRRTVVQRIQMHIPMLINNQNLQLFTMASSKTILNYVVNSKGAATHLHLIPIPNR